MALFLSFLIAIKNGWYDVVVNVLDDSRYEHFLEAEDVNQQRPLHIAAKHNQLRIVMALLARGARMDAQDRHGNTPLHLTVMFGAADVFNFLLRVGASTQLVDVVGATAVDWLFCRPPATTTAHPELRSVYLQFMLQRIAYAVGGPVTLIYSATPAPPYVPLNMPSPAVPPAPAPLRRPFGGPSAATTSAVAAAAAAAPAAAPRRTPPPPPSTSSTTLSAPPRQETPHAHARRTGRCYVHAMDGMDAIRQHQQIPAPLPINHLSREELDMLLLRQRQQAYAGMVRSGTEDEDPAILHRQREAASFSSMDTEINLFEESMDEEEEEEEEDDEEYLLGI
ncbi:hypothetical protein R5R35_011289 [Gryllus longicercus]|uniref:Uncharacterized protein n=1 Tax=Gryllus longicercus TaxID=2509291 RepID=A0AAN9Z361_9ORTH